VVKWVMARGKGDDDGASGVKYGTMVSSEWFVR
jgi:hypothetical protein